MRFVPRQLRVQFRGASYDTIDRRRPPIGHLPGPGGRQAGDVDRQDFLKVALPSRLRNETTLAIKVISARLHRGSLNSANAWLHP